ncbi:MAG: DUF1254 domain-containing protein [Bacteroidales bacterium]|nr:DUF1254 domain-containing protein [Bacteroidales bacterium]
MKLTPDEAREIASEAYVYGFPMVVNYKTMYLYSIDENSPEYKGPFNELTCEARLFTPEDKAVVTPNSDTPYCMFWVDIRNEPRVLSLPEMEPERFYHFQLIDLYTHNYAYLGTLTTGNKEGKYIIASQSWEGKKPEDIEQVIRCETDLFFVVVRTQMMNAQDLENVKQIQGEYQLEPLSAYLGTEAPEVSPAIDFPVWNEGDQFTYASLEYLDVMLGFLEPAAEEIEIMKRFARLGIGTEQGFDITRFDEEVQKAIEEGVQDGFKEIEGFVSSNVGDPLVSAKIFGTREFLKNSARENYQMDEFYTLRAVAAHMGLYGNSGAEAIYPTYLTDAEGIPLNGAENMYTVTFQQDELPPVRAFWSLTMYDGQTQLFIHNSLNRYLLNSSMKDYYVYGDDGSLTLYIQKDSPGTELESNWLPAPDGPFYSVMRLYGPEEAALQGEWVNPPMVKSK